MPTLALTVAGVAKTLHNRESLHITQVANGRTTASFDVLSKDGTYRPALRAEVLIEEDGTRIFGGLIDTTLERGRHDGTTVQTVTTVNAVDFNAYAERRYVNETIVAGTLKAALIRVTTYLATYGVTLDAAQVNGPSLPELAYSYIPLVDVLNELATLTADAGEPYVWRISPTKVLRMYQPSTDAAPFDLTGSVIAEVQGDIEVETTNNNQANEIILIVSPKSEQNRVETFTEGVDSYPYTLQYTLTASRGYVTHDGIYETLTTTAFTGTASWDYDPVANTLTRVAGAPSGGAVTSITFDGTYSATVTASDAGDIATNKLTERVVRVPEVPSNTTAQAMADSILAKSVPATKTLHYVTREPGLIAGQRQTVTVSKRNLSGVAVVTETVLRAPSYHHVERTVTAVFDDAQTNLDRGYGDVYRAWAGDKTGGSAPSISAGTGSVAQNGPGGPDTAVQFNRAGTFGGVEEFEFDEDTNSVKCGDACTITAVAPLNCQAFGVDVEIADPS